MKLKEIKEIVLPEEKRSMEQFTFMTQFIFRPISLVFTKFLIKTPVTPNCISLLSFFCVAIGLVVLWFTDLGVVAWGCFMLWGVLDCADGNIARIKKMSSKNGELWDAMAGYACFAFMMLGMGIYAGHQTGNSNYIVLGALSSIFCLYPRLLMQKKRADFGSDVHLNDKNSYSLMEKLAFFFTSCEEMPMLAMLIAVIFPLSWLYVAGYTVVYFLIAFISSARLLRR